MYQDYQGLPRRFYKEQCKEGEERADKRNFGRITSLVDRFEVLRRDALRESVYKIKWRERVARSVAPQRSQDFGKDARGKDPL